VGFKGKKCFTLLKPASLARLLPSGEYGFTLRSLTLDFKGAMSFGKMGIV
jgi:hypothetical protein